VIGRRNLPDGHRRPPPAEQPAVFRPHFNAGFEVGCGRENINVIRPPPCQVDTRRQKDYVDTMSIRFRLAAMCLALAFLGGSVAHGVTGTAMALEMASAVSMDASSDAKCSACVDETDV
tara:strand:+ start:1435 stop:1791 length:357 start_codon:yes stop_codon:yes gene_type:complete